MISFKNLAAALFCSFSIFQAEANNQTTTSNGNWTDNIWQVANSSKNKVTISSTRTVTLNTNVTNIDTLVVNGTLYLGSNRTLTLNNGGIIIVNSGGMITGGSSNSQFLFNGSSNATISGPWNGSTVVLGPVFATGSTNGFNTLLVALPIEVINFESIENNGDVQIKFSLSGTNELLSCELLQSNDDNLYESVKTFETIGHESMQSFSYSIRVETLQYFKLRITDVNGKISYSKTIVVNPIKSSTTLDVYPIPAHDVLNIRVSNEISGIYKVVIKNALGNVVNAFDNLNQIEINTTEYASGIYFIEVINQSETTVKKIIIN